MSSAVRSKIASYEAHNKQVSNGSPSSMAIKGSVDASTSGSTSTAVAAQNRVSRMRQEQMTRDGKSQQSNIVEKRKLLKERRMLQQKRTPASDALGVSIDKRVNLSRRTEYSPAKSEPSLVADQREKEAGPRVTSPGRQANRLSKMQRMQKMKGYDPSKKAANAPAKASVAASSTASTATTAVAHNSANKAQPLQRRQRTTLMQSRAKRVSNVQRVMPATPETPASDVNVNIDPMSPQPASRSFSHLSAASPNSEFDTYGATDHSVEPTTDDEATLTSVRRIMTRDNVDEISKREKSHHYHHLQAQSTRGDDSINASHRSGRTMQASQFALGSLQPKGAAKLSISGHTHSRPDRRRKWSHEGKSDKIGIPDVFRAASSSDYDTDGDISKTSRQSNALDGPSQSQATDVNDFFARSKYANSNRRMDDDDRTFDYGDRDDDSNGSNSFEARRRREAEQHLPENIPSKEWRETEPQRGPSSLINKDDVEHYTRSLGSPAMKIGVGVIGAVTVGCIVLGPAGLLAGAACIGFGVGVMQIPDEEREKIQAKMQKTVNRVHEKAVDATESLSNSCAATYEESGVAEHLPPCLSLPVAGTAGSKDHESTRSEKRAPKSTARETMVASKGGQKAAVPSSPPPSLENGNPRSEAANSMERLRNKKVACLRNAPILPPGRIHGLDPSAQPKAWLDVVASATTSEVEKVEAMEEILILAKDKRRARIFLEEGILDSLIWTLDRYFEKAHASAGGLAKATVSCYESRAVRLAASCLFVLGKAHCAAIHTEGDLQLMSLYERGSVPEERQVAQLLYEIPHHVRVTRVADPTIIDPSKEVFALRQLSLQQAEELARSVKAVVDGQL